MICKNAAELIKDKIGYKNAFGVTSQGRAGGLCIYWKEEVDFSLVSFSSHHICGDIRVEGQMWRFIGIYGWAKEEEKFKTWDLIRHLCENISLPLLVGGDFSEILSYDEKDGGVDRNRREMGAFRDLLDDCALRDLGFDNPRYTWERGLSVTTRIRERLDRFVSNLEWTQIFPNHGVENLLRYKSDHSPIVTRLKAAATERGKRRGFRFETCWLLDAGCEEAVKEVWEASSGDKITRRLSLLDELNEKQEAYWYLRSRVAEVKDGDKNTQYFHHKASQRKKRNFVKGLQNDDGVWCSEIEEIEIFFANYFSTIFTSCNPSDVNLQHVLQYISPIVSDDCNCALLRPYTKDEIYAALSQMHPCKAPGPDGMHAIFYQRFWHIIGDDISDFVCGILHGHHFPADLNCSNIALIPKVKDPKVAAEFRPIALCNVLYKLVSKAIVLRLKDFLPDIVTEYQSAFVPGRLITDNALIAMEVFHLMKHRSRSRRGTIAMKLDMSKAYDRVEWGFLRKMLLTMGFDGRWVNLIMWCVSSVSYSFIINGRVRGSVVPNRGLRQGDPLSPYLFILVADIFSKMIQKKVQEKRLHGAKASRSEPEISHLLFADDSLLFTRATRQECFEIVDILNRYELAFGQKINYEKSEVSFSKGVRVEQKEALMGILKMRQVEKHEKYLGIPSVAGRSKKLIFASLLDRIWKKLQGWKEKLLSRAGKEVLLKAVIQAIPTYLMGGYKLPTMIIQKIQAAMARFWWGSSDTKRKIHWKNWEAMCTLKCLGGMGFKDLGVFNDALLGRQAWRLIHAPQSLLSRVLKAKYYPSCEFLDASLGYSCSYSWRSIWSAKALVKEGLVWRVGNGQSINIWEAPWVVDENGRYITSPRNNDITMVQHLIDPNNIEWRFDVIDAVFNERDKKCILAIPLCSSSPHDMLSWALTKDGHYSVKTAYMLGKGCNLENFHSAWVDLWSMEVSPKVRHFLWKLCTHTLPTRGVLFHRHLIDEEVCPWGCGEHESTYHAIFFCPRFEELWMDSGCARMRDNSDCDIMCDLVAKWKQLDSRIRVKGPFLMSCIWGERNNKVFNNKITPNSVLLRRVDRLVEEYGKYAVNIYRRQGVVTQSLRYWNPPSPGCWKINVDASLATEGWVGLGIIARDHLGGVRFATTRRTRAFWSPEIAEAKAIEMGVRLGKRFGLVNVVIESDCLTVINRLQKTSFYLSDLDNVLSNIFSMSSNFHSLGWSHVKRDGNFVSHHLAKLVPFGVEQIWENHFPSEVAPYILMDNLSHD
ncbi:uncharacterized protein LOC104884079 [Beta vulgaris subsp. vulgaris]|uniref:uncharacterized protein LOC104884079 n=1 Tax=Beta vulgaris subsp. vulgaris TaxID=3555 RepID=UPI002036FF21|nr:uncharacterized protein LOC104884079 [Beta vulgaris subsp. vulgaris]